MRKHKATFIQDATDLIEYLRRLTNPIMEAYVGYGIDEESVITWIVKEYIEKTHNLITLNHDRLNYPHMKIFDIIRSGTSPDFEQVMNQFLKVPKVYGDDSDLLVAFIGVDLYIQYYSERVPYVPY